MERDAIRLECLKLRHRHDRLPAQVIADAKELEDYVIGPRVENDVKPPKRDLRKKIENPTGLS